MTSSWNPIDTAAKDGSFIIVRSVSGTDSERVMFEGLSSWRSEYKGSQYDPLTGECFAKAGNITGWMRSDCPYRIPGKVVGWKELSNG